MAALSGPSFGSWAKMMTSRLTTRQPPRVQPSERLGEEEPRVGILPARVGVGVELADVAEAGGAEQGVGDGVQHHVGVGMADQAARMLDADAAQDQRPAFGQPVRVVPDADPECHDAFLRGFNLRRL